MILMYPKIKLMPDNPTYDEMIVAIGRAAGICYNVDINKKTTQEIEEYVRKRIAAKHESILEHKSLSVEFTVDRGITHELVRHRLCAFTQSSTRYCDYTGDKEDGQCKFIIPPWVRIMPGQYTDMSGGEPGWTELDEQWYLAVGMAERFYHSLRKKGWAPEMARSVLPNSTMARIMVTANVREWQHILRLRAIGATGKPHPQMREVMVSLLLKFAELYPVFFRPLLEVYYGDIICRKEKQEHYQTEVL